MMATSARLIDRSDPPASPSVTMQYATSTPAWVQTATDPAAPKSTSSGCAVTTRIRPMPSVPAPVVIGARKWVSDTVSPRWCCPDRSPGRSTSRERRLGTGSVAARLPLGQVGQPLVVGEDLDDRDLQTDPGLDALDLEDLVPLHQGDHQPGLAGAGGPTRT